MKKFEELHCEDQLRIALELYRLMSEAQQLTIARFARVTDRTEREVWHDLLLDMGFDECEPWNGYPNGPKRESWNPAGADRELSPAYDKLHHQIQGWLGRDKH
jgi:hypothetical protein